MNEKSFSWYFLFEGLIAFVLGILMLVLPSYTSITFTFLASVALIFFGIYKFFQTIFIRDYIEHFWLNLFFYAIITALAVIMFLNPDFSMLIITCYVAAYLIFLGSSYISMAFQTKNFIRYWWINLIIGLVGIIAGAIIILALPFAAFWVIGMFLGACFIAIGATAISFFVLTR